MCPDIRLFKETETIALISFDLESNFTKARDAAFSILMATLRFFLGEISTSTTLTSVDSQLDQNKHIRQMYPQYLASLLGEAARMTEARATRNDNF